MYNTPHAAHGLIKPRVCLFFPRLFNNRDCFTRKESNSCYLTSRVQRVLVRDVGVKFWRELANHCGETGNRLSASMVSWIMAWYLITSNL